MTLWLGKLEVKLMQLGRGHTKGDTVVWLPQESILFSGDLVEYDATPYAGDAYFQRLARDARCARRVAAREARSRPRRGAARAASRSREGLASTRAFVSELYAAVKRAPHAAARTCAPSTARPTTALKPKYGHWVIFDHCLPFDVTRAYDEATQHPRSAHLDRAARQGDVGGARRPCAAGVARRGRVATPMEARLPEARASPIGARRIRCVGAGRIIRSIVVGAGPVGLAMAIDLAQHGSRCCCSTTTTSCRRLARDLLRQAHAGDLRPARLRRARRGQGRVVERRQGVLPRRARLHLRPAAGSRARAVPRSSTCSSTTSKAISPITPRAAESRHALEEQSRRDRAGARSVEVAVETPEGRYRSAATMSSPATARARRARHARPAKQGPRLPRPLPDRRRPDESGLSRPSAGSGSTRRFIASRSRAAA